MENTNIIHYSPFSQENNYLKLHSAELVDITIENATFTSCLFFLGSWKKIAFKNCRFQACVFDSLDLRACNFENCTFCYSKIDSCTWITCSFKNTTWTKTTINYSQWTLCDIDKQTSELIQEDDQEDLHEVHQNTTTWTFHKKATYFAS